MYLNLKAKHFNGSAYGSNCDCPLAKAAKEQFDTEDVSEGVDCISINDDIYKHENYDEKDFKGDRSKAKNLKFSEEVIKKIRLTKAYKVYNPAPNVQGSVATEAK